MKNIKPVTEDETKKSEISIEGNYVLNITVKANKPEVFQFIRQLFFNCQTDYPFAKYLNPHNYSIEKYYEARELAFENSVDFKENYMNVESAAELRDMLNVSQFRNCLVEFENCIKDEMINKIQSSYDTLKLSPSICLNFIPDLINIENLSSAEINEILVKSHPEYNFASGCQVKPYYHKGELYIVITTSCKFKPFGGDRIKLFESIIKTYPELEFHICECAGIDDCAYSQVIKDGKTIKDNKTDYHIIFSKENSSEIDKCTSLKDVDEDTFMEKLAYWHFRILNMKFRLCNNPDCGVLIQGWYGDKCPCCGKKKYGSTQYHGCSDNLKYEFPLALDVINSVGSSYRYITKRILDMNGEIKDGTVQ